MARLRIKAIDFASKYSVVRRRVWGVRRLRAAATLERPAAQLDVRDFSAVAARGRFGRPR
jgi:hypothetical protein